MASKLKKQLRVGVFGATGMVGSELISVLSDRKFPLTSLRLFASENSVGKKIKTAFGTLSVEHADTANYSELDLAFYAIGGTWPKEHASQATAAGCVVIDNSSTFRYDPKIPLVIPEINAHAIGTSKLIANPNCTTAIASIPLHVIHQHFGLKKVFVSTYQATSGAGASGMDELLCETRNSLDGKTVQNNTFVHPIPFNLIPHIDVFQENGYTKEEMKVVWELRKILELSNLAVSCTSVRIPILRAHSETIVVETEKKITPQAIRSLFMKTKGITVRDDPSKNVYPMPLTASKQYDVEVGRIRQNLIFGEFGLEFFVCGDQILKGAALNAVQIAEHIFCK